jgi:hypothetical protein
MTAFKKFDAYAFLERQQLPDSPVTLATLATLAARPAETEISYTDVCAATTGPDEQDNNQIQSPTPAKVAKVAKVQHPASASPYQGIPILWGEGALTSSKPGDGGRQSRTVGNS